MKQNIETAINALPYQTRTRVMNIHRALETGKVSSMEFSGDGSCVTFTYYSPDGDHGCPCTMASTLRTDLALLTLAGHRAKSHEHPTCF